MGLVESLNEEKKITRSSFEFKFIIGRGGFGKVWKAVFKKNNIHYAIKEMSKVKIIDRKNDKSVMWEKIILSRLHHSFITNLIYSFQDYDYLYLVMDFLIGGDLRFHLRKMKQFTEEQTKFILACVVLGLEYIHSNKIIHHDIKPENLLLDDQGYIKISDFGIAKEFNINNERDTSGTPGYIAPEVLFSQKHSYLVDYYALGVLGYEFMLGTRPYVGRSRKDIKQEIVSKQVQINANEVPIGWSDLAADLFNNLIQRKPTMRLGINGLAEIKKHKWFNSINWTELFNRQLISPFTPFKEENFDNKYCNIEEKIGIDTKERYNKIKSNENYPHLFNFYTFDDVLVKELRKYATPSTNSTKSSPSEHVLKFPLAKSPKTVLKDTPEKTGLFVLNKRKANRKRELAKQNDNSLFSKDSLPLINSSCRSMQKSFSVKSTLQKDTSLFNNRKSIEKMFTFKKESPMILAKRASNNYFKLTLRYSGKEKANDKLK